MQIVFHERFHKVYTGDPAAASGRLKPVERSLRAQGYEFVEPEPAPLEAIARVHDQLHVERIQRERKVGPLALLAAGGALRAAELAFSGEPAFALIRPPGHHASADSCWGFCFFNNMAVAVADLLARQAVGSALILDIDLHFGDGTQNILGHRRDVQYLHPEGRDSGAWTEDCRQRLDEAEPAEIIAVSAGFDRHIEDWGTTLFDEDYRTVGRWVGEWSAAHCGDRAPFVVLEGGYNHEAMAGAAVALCEGLEQAG